MTKYKCPPSAVFAIFLIFSSISSYSQSELIASNDADGIVIPSTTTIDDHRLLVVDVESNAKTYPTMEEEMKMYINLKSKAPQAYFFPNPSNGILWIEHNLGENSTVRIKDIEGVEVYKAQSLHAKKLNFASFGEGSYIIEVDNGKDRLYRELEVR